MGEEKVIVSLTTWSKRIHNLPIVLDSIYTQTYLPDKVVLNLAHEEVVPSDVATYLKDHEVEVYYTEDTKVYKKFLPTLKRYPEACVINVDDDCIYPNTMIEDFMIMHEQYPQFPISGNRVVQYGMQCHCGCSSLTKAAYFGEWLDKIDNELMMNCPSSDIVYTYFAVQNGHPYIRTNLEYFQNVVVNNLESESYTNQIVRIDGIRQSYAYLTNRFGACPKAFSKYIRDEYLAGIIENIVSEEIGCQKEDIKERTEIKILSSKAYRLGKFLLKPFSFIKNHL